MGGIIAMLAGAGVKKADPQYIGSVTKNVNSGGNWASSANALNVLSIAQTGDMVVIAFTFYQNAASWSWAGMSFTTIYNYTFGPGTPTGFIGFKVVAPGDANPYLNLSGFPLSNLTVVASVFRNVTSLQGNNVSAISSGSATDPPALTASGRLWVTSALVGGATRTNMTAPSTYTLGASVWQGSDPNASTTTTAYKIATLSSDNPGAFGGSPSGDSRGITLAFD